MQVCVSVTDTKYKTDNKNLLHNSVGYTVYCNAPT